MLKTADAQKWARTADFERKLTIPPELEIKNNDLPNLDLFKADNNRSFTEMLVDSMSEVNKLQSEANVAMEKLASGESKNLHETMLAVEKADIAFKTMNQVRLKVIEAYKEIMRMQI
ncbi:MAG: flagellar hook-basal body complex protein FliE [Bdellovibrionales bacterium RIFOXYD12_FULL_39_22]|nr:MAG: flagellar hook-basal body complex protein FliE [Bdellovibrionales bacterium RIFOXYB1_FULL_39_21]OFZ42157.1 MAG: flagellar hook-basal body complex protein FliE [Bdellovibrionales bacterium RIFOXYC12_FULL_39_17]OFZ50978.1 MAG: flagellar hook-basal body complex protein FliE [Bdellovibrionales bacterium RIFOXYC1_FULL_39_130]OFZ74502.1 MAG: flagellar hook-basal body complex protein FliE [Bdellovibrionales bacterium RIFOXYC2_FULL_39_8]OFZ78201.1 MAG: flagellar hook-basal body complex protein 